MRARSLTELELEAIADLDASIRGHDTFLFDGRKSQTSSIVASPSGFRRAAKSDLSSSTPRRPPEWPGTTNRDSKLSQDSLGNINAGYILYDGHEIQYISSSESQSSDVKPTKEASRQKDDSVRSYNSSLPPISKQQLAYGSNNKTFISDDFVAQSGYFLSHMQRLPTYAHFSIRQKIYFFLIGMAVILSFNTFHLSLTYFSQPQLFGKTVLSSLGTSHYTSSVVAMLAVVLKKRSWAPFIPTVPVCLLLMACLVILIPALAFAQVSVPVIAMYALICCNGLFTGVCQALIGAMAALFPGHKAILLVTAGTGFGSFLPSVVQLILLLCLPNERGPETQNSTATDGDYDAKALLTDNIYILSLVAFTGILLGIFAVARLRLSGIYKLFASKYSLKMNPRNDGLYKDGQKFKLRLRSARVYLIAEVLVSAVSMYVLSLALHAHETTRNDITANSKEFWNFHLATMFVVVFKLGDCLGMVLGTVTKCLGAVSNTFKKNLCFILALLRLGFVAAAVLFVRDAFLLYHNLFTISMYFILAITNGLLSSAMTCEILDLSRVGGSDTYPVVLEVAWLCKDFGNAVGAALSFVPLV